jgi:5'-phosphate synthase pdxT subunit
LRKKVGVLALQGDFEAHGKALAEAGAEAVYVRGPEQLAGVDGLILPGGESTTMLNLLHREGLFEPLREFGETKPIFGTCAGVILLAQHVTHPEQESLGLMDLTVERNGYGRQIDSAVGKIGPAADFEQRTSPGKLETVFIRAPIIRRCGPDVRVLAEYHGYPVLVEQNLHLGATFHPELSTDARVHQLFLSKL